MCLLSFYPAGAEVNEDHLRNGSESNSDGHGFAIVTPDGLESFRSMLFSETLAQFLAARELFPDGDALFHSRYTTHGLTTVENVHPFPVGRDGRKKNILVAHNGILPYVAQPDEGDPRSDTKIFAEDLFLPHFKDLDSPKTIKRLEAWLTPYNKLVILTTNPYYRKRSYILNEDEGTWVEGVWHSNSGYLKKAYTMWAYTGTGVTYSPKGQRYVSSARNLGAYDCEYCWAKDTVEFGMCRYCQTCSYCGNDRDKCPCFGDLTVPPVVEIGPRAITATPDAMATDFEDIRHCDWCGYLKEEHAVVGQGTCGCNGGASRADVEARAADVGMSEGEMIGLWDALMAEYNLRASNRGTP